MRTLTPLLLAMLVCFVVAGRADDSGDSALDGLVQLLGQFDDPAFQVDLLTGMHQALEGRKNVKMPTGWKKVYPQLSRSKSADVQEKALVLALIFRDDQAIASLKKTAADPQQEVARRRQALSALISNGVDNLSPLLRELTGDRHLRGAAIRGLARYSDEQTPAVILSLYGKLSADEKQDAIHALASRPAYALALLDAVGREQIPARDISTFTARQLDQLGDERVSELLGDVWGRVRAASSDKRALIAKYTKMLSTAVIEQARSSHGRAVFKRTCAQCHTLYDDGGKIGPDITGSNRTNLYYVLENVLDPSAAVAKAYQMTTVVTEGGRVITGIVQRQPNQTITVQTPKERIIVPDEDIALLKPSPLSMMPEGLFDKLSLEEIRDLVGYLATRQQVPLPE